MISRSVRLVAKGGTRLTPLACLAILTALQRYFVMKPEELADVECLLAEFPKLKIAYIKEVDEPSEIEGAPPVRRFYSCLVDGSCEADPSGNGKRIPKFEVELPGHPILGNGKSDNQNHAVIFTRGVCARGATTSTVPCNDSANG